MLEQLPKEQNCMPNIGTVRTNLQDTLELEILTRLLIIMLEMILILK